jgi:Beta-glucosidase-related glycosidases
MLLGPIMLDLKGPELTLEERDILRHPLVGGVILFSRNYVSPEQVKALIATIHGVRKPPLLVAVDQEGGRVQRFREGFTHLPALAVLGQIYDQDPIRAGELAETAGWLMAAELGAVGVDFSFAPVLDLGVGVRGVIGNRAFHRDPEVVSILAQRYVKGMQRAGMAATAKHFPGHGSVAGDSHLILPVDGRKYEDIERMDLMPFTRLISNGIEAVMLAHMVYPDVDSVPAGFSKVWIQTILRERLEFQGVVFSDDLAMAAAAIGGSYPNRVRLALSAGCDMVLVCNQREGAVEILDHLDHLSDLQSAVRLAHMHGSRAVDRMALRRSRAWQEAVVAIQQHEPTTRDS